MCNLFHCEIFVCSLFLEAALPHWTLKIILFAPSSWRTLRITSKDWIICMLVEMFSIGTSWRSWFLNFTKLVSLYRKAMNTSDTTSKEYCAIMWQWKTVAKSVRQDFSIFVDNARRNNKTVTDQEIMSNIFILLSTERSMYVCLVFFVLLFILF